MNNFFVANTKQKIIRLTFKTLIRNLEQKSFCYYYYFKTKSRYNNKYIKNCKYNEYVYVGK